MFTSRMFDMWSSVTSKLEAQTQIQTNIQQTTLQNSSSGSIKGKKLIINCMRPCPESLVILIANAHC